MRLMLFKITLKGVKTKTSVHLVRHSQTGQFHLVGSNRADWKGKDPEEWDKKVSRETPVNHVMLLNAQHLINMANVRLCTMAEKETREVMELIRQAVYLVDPDLAKFMVPTCVYRGGICPEKDKLCANMKTQIQEYRRIYGKTV